MQNLTRTLHDVPTLTRSSMDSARDSIGKELLGALADVAKYGKKTVAPLSTGNHILANIHQYQMWKLAFNTSYALFKSASDESPGLPADDLSDGREPDIEMLPVIDKWFTTDDTTKIKSELDMAAWGAKADLTLAKLEYYDTAYGGIQEYSDKHVAIRDSIELCKQAIDAADDVIIGYNNTGLIINIGLLLLNTPDVIRMDDIDVLMGDIGIKIEGLDALISVLGELETTSDPEIEHLLGEFIGTGLNDYVDNILTGRVFGLGDASSHAAAIVNMATMAEGILGGCIDKLRFASQGQASISATTGIAISQMGRLVTAVGNQIFGATRAAARKILATALGAIGISNSLIDVVMGIKMQIKSLERQYTEAMANATMINRFSPASMSSCPIADLLSIQTTEKVLEAAYKNMAMLPFMSLANIIVKPIFDQLTDLTKDIRSYQDMVGEALASTYKTISMQRWVDYALSYQINKLREYAQQQRQQYIALREALNRLKQRSKKPDRRLDLINKAFASYIRRLRKAAIEHDQLIFEGESAQESFSAGISVLQATVRLLTSRSVSDKDKKMFLSTLKNYEHAKETEKGKGQKIRDSYKNLAQAWDNLVNMRQEDFICRSLVAYLNTFRIYGQIVKIVCGLDLNRGISTLQDAIVETYGPLPTE